MTDRHADAFADLRAILVNELRVPAAQVTSKASVHDLGIDSLARMELSVALEHCLGIGVPAESLQTAETVNDIVLLIERAPGPPTRTGTN
ncbi:acyl carrier protein [Streptomyces sp. NPDC058623]|uniref:acyl carrier protein n=1 Tax=Streptomyces sp. NPDC058623 TaxID=3346563 RepID=UPI003657A61C